LGKPRQASFITFCKCDRQPSQQKQGPGEPKVNLLLHAFLSTDVDLDFWLLDSTFYCTKGTCRSVRVIIATDMDAGQILLLNQTLPPSLHNSLRLHETQVVGIGPTRDKPTKQNLGLAHEKKKKKKKISHHALSISRSEAKIAPDGPKSQLGKPLQSGN